MRSRYHADQVGPLVRPKYLLNARASFARWLQSQEGDQDRKDEETRAKHENAAKAAEQRMIKEVIGEQLDRGIRRLVAAVTGHRPSGHPPLLLQDSRAYRSQPYASIIRETAENGRF